jgi:hypothetical protein
MDQNDDKIPRSSRDKLIRMEVEIEHLKESVADMHTKVATSSRLFTDEQVRKILRMIDVFEEESSDRKEFDRAVRVSVITMVISALVFSILVPVAQHFILH